MAIELNVYHKETPTAERIDLTIPRTLIRPIASLTRLIRIHRACGGEVKSAPLGLYSCKRCDSLVTAEGVESRLEFLT